MTSRPKAPEPQFFAPNQLRLPVGPARVAEVTEARVRRRAAQQAVGAARDLKDALVMCQQLDKTGNFDGGLDHALATWERVNEAMRELRSQGLRFLEAWDDEDAA